MLFPFSVTVERLFQHYKKKAISFQEMLKIVVIGLGSVTATLLGKKALKEK